jgi:hypothetical protein
MIGQIQVRVKELILSIISSKIFLMFGIGWKKNIVKWVSFLFAPYGVI